MRRSEFAGDRARGVSLFERAPFVHLAGLVGSRLVLRALHGVVVDGVSLAFHGAKAGEKRDLLGSLVVVSTERIVAEIPSYFTDPVHACPATTLYESVEVRGVLEKVTDEHQKAQALARLMARFQPEGGHVPIDPSRGDYASTYSSRVRGVEVMRVSLDDMTVKAKLGQNWTAARRDAVIASLARRSAPGDAAAIEAIVAAGRDPT